MAALSAICDPASFSSMSQSQLRENMSHPRFARYRAKARTHLTTYSILFGPTGLARWSAR